MQSFVDLTAMAAPLDRANVDTDAILPKQFMKSIRRAGFGDNLFDEWRYLDRGEPGQDPRQRRPNPDFSLNHTCRAGAQVLLTRENFGCGSSREHAVWALRDYGIRALIAPSFAEIFYANCFKNGLLPIVLTHAAVEQLFALADGQAPLHVHIHLPRQTVSPVGGLPQTFRIDAARKERLLLGLDDIDLALRKAELIRAYERRRAMLEPWAFGEKSAS